MHALQKMLITAFYSIYSIHSMAAVVNKTWCLWRNVHCSTFSTEGRKKQGEKRGQGFKSGTCSTSFVKPKQKSTQYERVSFFLLFHVVEPNRRHTQTAGSHLCCVTIFSWHSPKCNDAWNWSCRVAWTVYVVVSALSLVHTFIFIIKSVYHESSKLFNENITFLPQKVKRT